MPFEVYMLIAVGLTIGLFSFLLIRNKQNQKYRTFVEYHSIALRKLKEINSKYVFVSVKNHNMTHNYDNEKFYKNISPADYLTYQLVYQKKQIQQSIDNAKQNQRLYKVYIQNVNSIPLARYDTENIPRNINKVNAIEKKRFNFGIQKPDISFNIKVVLNLTKINERFITSKSASFSSEEIEHIIERLNQKYGNRYLNDDIWEAICRVERGRVSNKMRFSIYERDGHRCKKCGATRNLEVDHIFPISKGGKSTYDNLQTLCHKCNTLKSNTVEAGTVNLTSTSQRVNEFCANCGAPLVRVKGKYGDFYGCSNYPQCKFTKLIDQKRK